MMTYALLTLGEHRIAIPHSQILGIENISDARADDSTRSSYWVLARGQRQWAVYSLDAQLQLQALPHPQHRLLVCLKHHPVALTCLQVDALPAPDITPLPAMMHNPGCAVTGLLLHQHQLVFQIDTDLICQRRNVHNFPSQPGTTTCNAMPGC